MSEEMIRLLEEACQEVEKVDRLLEDPLVKNWTAMACLCLLNAQQQLGRSDLSIY